jgi:ubiquinone/menaquinone biosynthesis C-methylase UbiE
MQHDPRLASSRLHANVERLHAQAVLSWQREAKALLELGLRDGMSILEVGSGPGFVTELLLERLPHSTVTAVDLDPHMISIARDRLAAQFGDRVDFVHASILNTDLASDAFDFALARYVLQHVAAPDMALLEVHRLLQPGGTLAILDIDDALGGLVSPYLPAFELVARKVRQAQAGRAGDREIGRKLWRLLVEADFVNPDLAVIVLHSDQLGLESFLPQYHPDRYQPFVIAGSLTTEELDSYRGAYEQFVATPDASIVQLMLLASGRKPHVVEEPG